MSVLDDIDEGLLPSSWSPLHLASFADDTDRLRELIVKYPDKIDGVDSNGRTPLQIALESHHVASMALLIDNGASISSLSLNGATGIDIFDVYIDLGIQVLLSSTSRLELSSNFLSTALCSAVMEKNSDMLWDLLSRGGSDHVNTRDTMGLSPVHYSSINGDVQCMRALLSYSANIEILSKTDLATPLHYACRHGNIEIVDLLLKESTDSNVLLSRQDIKGCTPTHWALYNEHWDLVGPLIASFQDGLKSMNAVDSNGYTIRGLLYHLRFKVMPSSYQSSVPCLSREEADWLLHVGVSDASEDVVLQALDEGADPNVFDFCHQTPLILSAKLGLTEISRLLLTREGSKCADVNLSDWDGLTPLHHASRNGHIDVVALLLQDPSINIYAMSRRCSIPLEIALERGHLDLSRALLDACNGVGTDGFRGNWVNLLSLAAASNDLSILKNVINLFCPSNWTEIISSDESSLVFSKPNFKRKPPTALQVFNPLEPSPRLYANDIRRLSKAKKKLESHTVDCKEEFKAHPTFGNKVKKGSFQSKYYGFNSSPVHCALYGRSNVTASYLLTEISHAKCLDGFFKLKDSTGITGAALLSEMIDNGSISIEPKMEHDLLDHLTVLYELPQDIPIGWALVHFLLVNLANKRSCGKPGMNYITPLERWPILLIKKYISHYQEFNSNYDIADCDDIMKLTAAILER
jgi:ankyrin repeat protein